MYNVYSQGMLVYQPQVQVAVPVQYVSISNPVPVERQEIIQAKHEERSKQRTYSSSDNVFFCPGGLIYVGNPYYFDYNCNMMSFALADGLHDGLNLLPEIHFDDVLDHGMGDLGGFADFAIPDISFDGLGDAVGFAGDVVGGAINIGGDVVGFIGDVGGDAVGAIGDVGGDAVEFAGGAVGAVGEAIGNADIGEGILNVGKEIFEGIGSIAGKIFDLLDVFK